MSSTESISSGSNASQIQFLQQLARQRHSQQSTDTQTTSSSDAPNKADQTKFLDKFTKDFGSDAAKSITNEDGSVNFDKMKDFFDKKLSSMKFGSSSEDGGFNPMMAMMMGGSGNSQSAGSGDMPNEMQDKILDGISDKFGSSTAKSLTNDDGTINKDKFQNFMKEHMSEMGSASGTSSTDATSQISDFNPLKSLMDALDKEEKSSSTSKTKQSHHLSKDESSKVLDKFTKDFGEDAAKSITNEDGMVDGDKLMSYLKEKLGGANSANSNDTSSTGFDFSKLLNQAYGTASLSNDNIFDTLFGNEKNANSKTGNLVNATA